jgi:hypothetical protein
MGPNEKEGGKKREKVGLLDSYADRTCICMTEDPPNSKKGFFLDARSFCDG